MDQLLCVARLDSAALDVPPQRVDLTATARQGIGALAPFALGKRCELALEASETPVEIQGNADAIEDALRNLIENAIAHSPPDGEVRVSIRSPGIVRIADQDPGIPPELRDQVFERFWRARGPTHRCRPRALAIVRDIMCAHGGTVRTVDNSGGAVFILEFGNETRNKISGGKQD